jgi:hypothetical protein
MRLSNIQRSSQFTIWLQQTLQLKEAGSLFSVLNKGRGYSAKQQNPNH